MAKKKKRIPPKSVSRQSGKQVRTQPSNSLLRPAWRFSTADKGGDFAWPLDEKILTPILHKLHEFDGMKWSEIEGRLHHSIDVNHLSKKALQRLQQIKQDDQDSLFSFRLKGEERVFCIKDRGIAKILWYDPKHQVCISNKKHT